MRLFWYVCPPGKAGQPGFAERFLFRSHKAVWQLNAVPSVAQLVAAFGSVALREWSPQEELDLADAKYVRSIFLPGHPYTICGSQVEDKCGDPIGSTIPQINLPKSSTATTSVIPVDMEALWQQNAGVGQEVYGILAPVLGYKLVTWHVVRQHLYA